MADLDPHRPPIVKVATRFGLYPGDGDTTPYPVLVATDPDGLVAALDAVNDILMDAAVASVDDIERCLTIQEHALSLTFIRYAIRSPQENPPHA